MNTCTHTVIESQAEALRLLPDLSADDPDALRKTGTEDVDEKRDVQRDISRTQRRFFPDNAGQPPLRKAAGSESLNFSDSNEKACPAGTEQASGDWLPGQDLNLKKQNQNLL